MRSPSNRFSSLFLLATLLLSHAAAGHAQRRPPEQWRAPPPPDSIVYMPKVVRMGTDQGHKAKLKGIEITDSRFKPFLIQITLTGDRKLDIREAEFKVDESSFTSRIDKYATPKETIRLQGFAQNEDAVAVFTEVEERNFNIEFIDALLLSKTKTLEITLTGRLQKRHYVVKPKQLARLREWLAPRIEKHRAPR